MTSTPSKASVTINGKWTGRTPLTLERPFGKYAIRVVQPGYNVTVQTITLSASASSRTIDVTLDPKPSSRSKPVPPPKTAAAAPAASPATQSNAQAGTTGEIFVDSRPQGARVFIDGKPLGVTPLRVTGQAAGSHDVRLELADHQPWTSTTRVVGGATARVTGSLDRIVR